MAETPAAPLEKAVEESREALAAYERCSDPECSVCVSALEVATRALLAALDADRGEAEAALREIEKFCECGDDPACPSRIARRYFARREEKGENRG